MVGKLLASPQTLQQCDYAFVKLPSKLDDDDEDRISLIDDGHARRSKRLILGSVGDSASIADVCRTHTPKTFWIWNMLGVGHLTRNELSSVSI